MIPTEQWCAAAAALVSGRRLCDACVLWQATYLQQTRTESVPPVPTPVVGAQLVPKIEAYLTQHDIYQKLDTLVKKLVAQQPEDPIDFLVRHFQVACSTR